MFATVKTNIILVCYSAVCSMGNFVRCCVIAFASVTVMQFNNAILFHSEKPQMGRWDSCGRDELRDSRQTVTREQKRTLSTTVTRQRPVNISLEDLVCAVARSQVCERAIALSFFVVTSCKRTINPITNPKPVSGDKNVIILSLQPTFVHSESLISNSVRR
jgi:hypothetical protein